MSQTLLGIALLAALSAASCASCSTPESPRAESAAAGPFTDKVVLRPVPEKTSFDLVLQEVGPNKIEVVKAVCEITSLGLAEAERIVEGAPQVLRRNLSKAEAERLRDRIIAAGGKASVR